MSAMGSLDIRWPIGFIFTIYGGILLAYGAGTGGGVVVINSAAFRVDLACGIAFLIFGLFMGGLAIKGSRRASRSG
jgi:hypothetical protein